MVKEKKEDKKQPYRLGTRVNFEGDLMNLYKKGIIKV